MSEQQLQANCVAWFHNEPKLYSLRRMLHCNNNNSADRRSGNVAKAMGVMPGVSDLELVCNGYVAFIELKLPGKTQQPEQKDFQTKVMDLGHFYFIIYTLEEFKDLIWKLTGM